MKFELPEDFLAKVNAGLFAEVVELKKENERLRAQVLAANSRSDRINEYKENTLTLISDFLDALDEIWKK